MLHQQKHWMQKNEQKSDKNILLYSEIKTVIQKAQLQDCLV